MGVSFQTRSVDFMTSQTDIVVRRAVSFETLMDMQALYGEVGMWQKIAAMMAPSPAELRAAFDRMLSERGR